MNARIFKKLNKKAMQGLLNLDPKTCGHYKPEQFFPSEKGLTWAVSQTLAKRFPSRQVTIYSKGKAFESSYILLAKGTPMFGRSDCYGEWDEWTATEELAKHEWITDPGWAKEAVRKVA